jgi:hypothetical protein
MERKCGQSMQSMLNGWNVNISTVVPGHISGIVLLVLGGKGTPSMFNPVL